MSVNVFVAVTFDLTYTSVVGLTDQACCCNHRVKGHMILTLHKPKSSCLNESPWLQEVQGSPLSLSHTHTHSTLLFEL